MGKSAFKPGNMLYPLPAVMVSCQYPGTSDPECSNPALSGRPNILTVAWAGTVCTNPPMLSISVRPERYSYHMIEAAGRVRSESHNRIARARHRLLRRALRQGRRQIQGDASDTACLP